MHKFSNSKSGQEMATNMVVEVIQSIFNVLDVILSMFFRLEREGEGEGERWGREREKRVRERDRT